MAIKFSLKPSLLLLLYESPSSVVFNEAIIYIDNPTNNSVNSMIVWGFLTAS